jgi:hypothetical protein
VASSDAQARVILEEVDSLSVSMVTTADQLAMGAKKTDQGETQMEGLAALKGEVNRIGQDLRALETEETSLADWERSTVDGILPLMVEIAANTEKAIEALATNRSHMWATDFPEESAKVYDDAVKVRTIVDEHLKLASLREREQRAQAELGESR